MPAQDVRTLFERAYRSLPASGVASPIAVLAAARDWARLRR